MERQFIVTKDVCKITGKKTRYAQQLIHDLKKMLGKKKHQYLTKKELADYLGIDLGLIHLD